MVAVLPAQTNKPRSRAPNREKPRDPSHLLRLKVVKNRIGSRRRKGLRRTSSIRKVFHIVENSRYGEGVLFFTCLPGGAWGAAGNGGVPVLWGLGGGSGTALCFQSLVCFLAQAA